MSYQFSSSWQGLSEAAHRTSYLQLLAIAKERGVERFLDLGCGDGKLTVEFAVKVQAKEVYGVDIDEVGCSEASKKGINVIKADLNQPLPLPSDYFDLILCREVMQCLVDSDNLLRESHRLLKPKARFYICVPNLGSLHNRVLVLMGQQPSCIGASSNHILKIPVLGYVGGGRDSFRAFSPSAFKQMLTLYGFEIESYHGAGFYPFSGKMANLFSKLFPSFSVFQTIVAVKNK